MSHRLGKSGVMEGASTASIAMCTGALFTIESTKLYQNGNASYLTLPVSVLLSLILFLALLRSMEKCGAANLHELLSKGLGRFGEITLSILLVFILLFRAYAPLGSFIRSLHGLFFEGVSYRDLIVFVAPTVFIVAILGFETIARTAKCFAVLLASIYIVSLAAAYPEFDVYRLYPLLGSGAAAVTVQIAEEVGVFFPALLSLLIIGEGLNDLRTARRIGVISSAVSALVCFTAQMALGLVYTYEGLSRQFMPFFHINYLNMFEAHFMRLDKLANIVFMNGAILTGAFHIYGAARLYSQSFGIRDIRPPVTAFSLITAILVLLETELPDNSLFASAKGFVDAYGFMLVCIPAVAASAIAAIRYRRKYA